MSSTRRGARNPRRVLEASPEKKARGYIGTIAYSKPKKQFIALYRMVGTFKTAVALAKDLILWPENAGGMPPEGTLRTWASLYDDGQFVCPPDAEAIMAKKLEVYPKWRHFKMLESNMDANEHLVSQIKDGTFNPAMTAALQHTANAANYGVQTRARAEDAASGGAKQTFNFNNFKMITGKKKPALKGGIVNVKVLPSGDG